MEVGQIVSSIVIGLISILAFIYSFFTSKEKGPILTNSYFLATKEERDKTDKSAEYRSATIIYRIAGIMFLLIAISIVTSWAWLYYMIYILAAILVSYVIIVWIKSEIKNK